MPLKFYSRIWLCAVFDKFLGFLQYSKCKNFYAFIPYLAMSYFDHYIARGNLVPVCFHNLILNSLSPTIFVFDINLCIFMHSWVTLLIWYLFSQASVRNAVDNNAEFLAIGRLILAWKMRDRNFTIFKFEVNWHSYFPLVHSPFVLS